MSCTCTNRQTISGERVCEGEDTDTAPKKKLDHPTILAVVVSLERILPERYVARGTQHSLNIHEHTSYVWAVTFLGDGTTFGVAVSKTCSLISGRIILKTSKHTTLTIFLFLFYINIFLYFLTVDRVSLYNV